MTALRKAELHVLDRGGASVDTIAVQFNPTTMQLQMSNSVDGGQSRGRQTQQYNGSASTQLSIDLEFDTADEGRTDDPVDVRTRTDRVRQFVLPGGENSKQAPPRVMFRWGTFELIGVMKSLTEELSLFSADGVPLRSKLSVQINEQDPKFEALERGAGANGSSNPPSAGGGSTGGSGPGTSGGGPIDRAAAALAGETPADFLARNGLAPDAWRALGSALDALGDGIELQAGLDIGFEASLSLGAGIGVSAGFHAGIDASLDASLGLGTGSTSGARSGLQQGFALSAAGGVTAADEQRKIAETTAAADSARVGFGGRSDASSTSGGAGAPGRAPLAAGADGPVAPGRAATGPASAPTPPRADPRAVSFGRGVPLRDRVHVPGSDTDSYVVVGQRSAVAPTARLGIRPAPWERLVRPSDHDPVEADQHARRASCGCHRCDPFGSHR